MTKKKFILTLLSVLHPFLAFTEDVTQPPQPNQSSFISELDSEPSAFIHGVVNIITGNYTENFVDLDVHGSDPLTVSRTYTSHNRWTYSHQLQLLRDYFLGPPSNYLKYDLISGSETEACFEGKVGDIKYSFSLIGKTNCSGGVISGRNNEINNKLYIEKHPWRKKTLILKIVDGSGTERIFNPCINPWSPSTEFNLSKVNLASGNSLRYTYTSEKKRSTDFPVSMVKMRNRSGTVTSSLTYEEVIKDKQKILTKNVLASDGRYVKYHLIKNSETELPTYIVSKVESSDGIPEEYFYDELSKEPYHFLIRKEKPDHRYLKIDYYKKGNNFVAGQTIKIKNSKNKIYQRVKTLWAPVGDDETAIPIYNFIYEESPDSDVLSTVHVYDALNRQKTYHLNEQYHLEFIKKYIGNAMNSPHTLYSTERIYWGAPTAPDNTHLSTRTLENSKGEVRYCRYFEYDSRGNIITDNLYGNLTGTNKKKPSVNSNGVPEDNLCEKFRKIFKYSDDGMNLMTYANDGAKTFIYTYKKGTDLLAAKYTLEKEKIIKIREFYEYDENGAVIEAITDDGSAYEKTNMTSVTERRIKRIINTVKPPVALPEVAVESYLDMETGKEIPLRKITYLYNPQGRLLEQHHYDSTGIHAFSLTWQYDSKGNIISSTDALGQPTIRDYDLNKNLIFEQGPRQDVQKKYKYDCMNRCINEEEIRADGTYLSKSHEYDYVGNLIATNDIYGNTTEYVYDEFNRLIETIYPEVQDENGNQIRPRVLKSYDILGNVTSSTDSKGAVTRYSSTIRGNPYSISHPDGSRESSIYTIDGLLNKTIAKNGTYILYTHDFLGRVTRTETYSPEGVLLTTTSAQYNAFRKISETDGGGHTTFFTYDGAGRLVKLVKDNKKTTYRYDTLGRVEEQREWYGEGEYEYTADVKKYDCLNRVIEELSLDSSGNVLSRVEYGYDEQGQRNKVQTYSEAGIGMIRSEYDPHGLVILNVDQCQNESRTIVRYDYRNSFNQKVPYKEMIDPKGIVTCMIYDAMGRVVQVLKKNPFGMIIQKTNTSYDSTGKPIRTVDTVFTPEQSNREVVTSWCYDSVGRLTDLYEAVGTPEQKHTQKTYRIEGQLAKVIKSDGVVLSHAYDALGRLIDYKSSDGSIHYNYVYDRDNHLICARDLTKGMATLRSYDANGYLSEEILGTGISLRYTYDCSGRPLSVIFSDGSSIEYGYRAKFLHHLRRLSPEGTELYKHIYSKFDQVGNVIEEELIGSIGKRVMEYDLDNKLRSIRTDAWTIEEMAYDPCGNLLSAKIFDKDQEISTNYQYDDLHQLTHEQSYVSHTYAYDSLYNRITKDSSNYHLNALNQLLEEGDSCYEYDRNGNMIMMKQGDLKIGYEYDALDRLLTVTEGDSKVAYLYDDQNRRLSKTKLTFSTVTKSWKKISTEKYLYLGQNEIGACDADHRMTQLRVLGIGRGAEIGSTVAIELDGKFYGVVNDHQGNLVCIVDPITRKVVEKYSYTAFGEERVLDSDENEIASINPWHFSSKRVDDETGFINFGRRYYLPTLGRWLTPDPIGLEGGPNLYAYVVNNPLTHFDAYGLDVQNIQFSFHVSVRERPQFENLGRREIETYDTPEELKPHGIFERVKQTMGEVCKVIGEHLLPIPIIGSSLRNIGHRLCKGGTHENYVKQTRHVYSHGNRLHGKSLNGTVNIGWMNGVLNSLHDCVKSAKMISDYFGGVDLNYFYNSTKGISVDILEAVICKMGFMTNGVKQKYLELKQRLSVGSDLIEFAHSRGGIVLDAALKMLTAEEKSRINVRTFGSAKIIDDKSLKSCVNYISWRDPVPFVSDPIGCVKALVSRDSNTVFLKSNETPFIDHPFANDTYQRAVKSDVYLFRKEYNF